MSEFTERVYAECEKIPKGKLATYASIARNLKSSPRAVGQALKRNIYAPKVPCHRVVSSDGKIGGFMGKTKGREIEHKIKLLKKEGITVVKGNIKNFKEHLM